MQMDLSKIHQTSCEGYVTKRGHLLKSWKRRYMVLDGETLHVSYYDSKEIYQSKGEPKGSFVLTECEKQDLSDEGSHVKPFGFKFVGHCPGKGYKEFSVFVETQIDQTKWLNVAHNALGKSSSPQKTINQRIEEITGHKEASGLMLSMEAQMKNAKKTSKELLEQAIKDAKEADRIGKATVGEMEYQEEVLNEAEGTLDVASGQLEHAKEVGKELKHPILYKLTHLFSPKKKKKKGKGGHGKGGIKQPSGVSRTPKTSPVKLQPAGLPQKQEEDQLDELSKILANLGKTAETISVITDRTAEQVDRIDHKVAILDDQLKKEVKVVSEVLKSEAS
ncbi:hypothetical protein AC1031_000284 [Aphanomyces cochlioides]|nr:hypothetical protein AC1031_000284 [Aphanomyces cochlioides]